MFSRMWSKNAVFIVQNTNTSPSDHWCPAKLHTTNKQIYHLTWLILLCLTSFSKIVLAWGTRKPMCVCVRNWKFRNKKQTHENGLILSAVAIVSRSRWVSYCWCVFFLLNTYSFLFDRLFIFSKVRSTTPQNSRSQATGKRGQMCDKPALVLYAEQSVFILHVHCANLVARIMCCDRGADKLKRGNEKSLFSFRFCIIDGMAIGIQYCGNCDDSTASRLM